MKHFSLLQTGALAALAVCTTLAPISKADPWDRKTIITVNNPLEVPGAVLQPGKYVVKLFNSNSDRHIVQIMNEQDTKLIALTFTISAQRLDASGKTIITMYEGANGQPEALRTWFYPGDLIGQEFLYPHKQALQISERSKQKVPEASETESAAIESKDVDSPAVNLKASASRNENEERAEVPAKTDEPVVMAQTTPAPSPVALTAQAQEMPASAQPVVTPQASPQPAASTLPETLPQTAGEGPLAALIGSLSLALAFTLWSARRIRQQQ